MGVRDTGWIGVVGLIYGGCAMGACSAGWIGAMGLIYGDVMGCATELG